MTEPTMRSALDSDSESERFVTIDMRELEVSTMEQGVDPPKQPTI